MKWYLFILFLFPQLADAAFPTGWGRKCEIIIQSSKVSGTLTDFPVLLTETELPAEMFDAGLVKPDGGDIRFSTTSAGTTQLAAEIVEYDTVGTNNAQIWVKVPSVASASNTSIWVWYDSSASSLLARADTYGMENVWDANYLFVSHMEEASGSLVDATSNNHDFTVAGAPTFASTGKMGSGILYNAGTEKHVRPNTPAFDALTGVTITGWYRKVGTAGSDWGRMFTNTDGATSDCYHFGITNLQQGASRFKNTSSTAYTITDNDGSVFPTNTYRFSGMTWSGTTESYYTDGALDSVMTTTGTMKDAATSDSLGIGGHPMSTTRNLNGQLDEVRVSSSVRNVDWISSRYNNEFDPGTFALEQTAENGGITGCDGDATTSGGGETAYNIEDVIYYYWITTATAGIDTTFELTHINIRCRDNLALTTVAKCAVYIRNMSTGKISTVPLASSPELDLTNSSFAPIKFDMTDTVQILDNTQYAVAIWSALHIHPSRQNEVATYTLTNDTAWYQAVTYGSWPSKLLTPTAIANERIAAEICYNKIYVPPNTSTIPEGKIPETYWEYNQP